MNHLVKVLFSFRSCAVSTAGSGGPWPWFPHWEEHGYACQDCCNSCHIPEGRSWLLKQEVREGGREGEVKKRGKMRGG